MRVGLVCPYDMGSPGGVQQLTTELAAKLRALGEDVVVVAAGRVDLAGGPGIDAAVLPVGRPVRVRGNESRVPLTLSPLSWSRVRAALKRVDVVHVHEPLVPLLGWASLTVDKPTVATFHAAPPSWVSPLYRWAPFLARRMRRASLTAVSEAAAEAIPSRWGDVVIIPNAIEVASYRVATGRVMRRVAFLGRDEPRKGLDVLLGAWPAIRAAVPEAELVVMGGNREIAPSGVRFLGRVTGAEKRRLLSSSSVFVAPNTGGESFGIVLLEAMAAGCAVVASDIDPFMAVTGEAARHFPVGDPAALAVNVIELLQDDTAATALRRLGAARVEQFDWGVVAERYRDLYRLLAT